MRGFLFLLLGMLLLACSEESDSPVEEPSSPAVDATDTSPMDAPQDVSTGPASRCVDAVSWAPGTRIFEEATEAWGLHDLGVQGVLVHVTELDGDGWPDLIVHHEGGNDVFGDEPSRVT